MGDGLRAWLDGLSDERIRAALVDNPALKTPELLPPLQTFKGNLYLAGIGVSPHLSTFSHGVIHERAEWIAREHLYGSARVRDDPPEGGWTAEQGLTRAEREARVAELRNKYVLEGWTLLQLYPEGHYGIGPDMLLSCADEWRKRHIRYTIGGQIVLCWTAFEVLAGDLWAAALNARPDNLALLEGTPNRISQKAGRSSRDGQSAKAPKISISEIAKLTGNRYDLSARMGDLLAESFNFQTLDGIREAYSRAFSEHERRARTDTIDAVLADQNLNALSAIRNLITHRGGIVDKKYVEDVKSAPNAPQLQPGERLNPSDSGIMEVVACVVDRATRLVVAVDSWLVQTGGDDARATDADS